MSIVSNIFRCFKGVEFSLQQAYAANPAFNKESVRARIYENMGVLFRRKNKGVYITIEQTCIVIHGSGRNLSLIEDESIDCIITDHPWGDAVALTGGNRNLAAYPCYRYNLQDFYEKARVLKNGSFLCEIIPTESESNYEYLFKIKKWAEEAGFKYYAKVPWKKGNFVANMGRAAKNTEDILILSKGKARALRPDRIRGLDENGLPTKFLPGTSKMLPTCFDVDVVPLEFRIAQSEKPVELFEQLLEFVTVEGEIVLDQNAGSGAVGVACLNKNRKCILFEIVQQLTERIAQRIGAN